MNVLVAGGSGLVGQSLCRILNERGHSVTAASRSPDSAELPVGVETAEVDVTKPDLTDVVDGHDVVVNLVALPSHYQHRGRSHEAVHLEGTRHLVAASENADVDRFVQMSGLGVDSNLSTAYFRAKRRAENIVRESELNWVVFRPSVVFGDGCAFIPFIERTMPSFVAPLPGGGKIRIQPIWVDDLALMLADGVEDDSHDGEIYKIGGPEALTLNETVNLICNGVTVLPIPMPLARVAFTVAEFTPGVPFGRDQYRVQKLDNTITENDVTAFNVREDDLRTLSDYLEGEHNDA